MHAARSAHVSSLPVALLAALAGGASTILAPLAPAQQSLADHEDTYYANDGVNGRYDALLGEFAPDLGGFVPFARLDDARSLLGHVLAQRWDAALAGRSFRDMVFEHFTDLRALDGQLRKFGKAAVLPLPARAAVLEAPALPRTTWWGRAFSAYPYRIHGGPALVCISDAALAAPPAPIHLLLVNMPQHLSDFGVNRNDAATVFSAPASGWGGDSGAPILSPDEQALERGDVVVISKENLSESIWIALQRTQEAECFVRDQLLPSLGVTPDADSRSYLFGGSWGGIVSAFLALMQPKIYAGSAAYSMDDWSYGIGDQRMLHSFHAAATGMLVPDLPNDPFYSTFYAVVDLLGTRFDDPQTTASGKTMQPWDLAAFCVNRRPFELAVPVQGMVTGEDWIFNAHWSAQNGAFNPNFQPGLRRFLEHGGGYGVLPGKNEFAIWRGDEWAGLIAGTAGATPAAANSPIVPDVPLPAAVPAYPDPYSHTLRHVHVPAGPESFLKEIDLSPASHAPGSGVFSIGQGVFPALDDTMHVGNVDDDPRTEIVFGNLDGRVHVLEIDPARDPNDPFKLYDEWRSPYLGREVFSIAVKGHGARTVIYAADGLGQIWAIERKNGGFAVGPQPLCSPASAPRFLYPGPSRHLTLGNFARARPGLELFVYNRFCDWAMFSAADGAPIAGGRLQRSLHGIGATSAIALDLGGDGDDELVFTSSDGCLWAIDPPPDGDLTLAQDVQPVAVTPFTGLALTRVESLDLDAAPGVSHLLLFGRNDSLDDDGVTSPNWILVFDVQAREVVAQIPALKGEPLDPVSFAWLRRPGEAGVCTFVVSGPTTLQKITLRRRPGAAGFKATIEGGITLVDLPDLNVRSVQIDAIESFAWNGKSWLAVALGNGRILVLDSQLAYARTSMKEIAGDPDVAGSLPDLPWYSNRTLGRTFSCDLVQETKHGDASLCFAEFSLPLLRAPRRHRVGRLVLPASGAPSWDPWYAEAQNGIGHPARTDFNRRLRMADFDGDGKLEPHVYGEVGDFFFDPALGRHREFCSAAWHPPFFDHSDPLQWKLIGGHVFEIDELATSQYRYLGGFHPPRDPTQPYVDFGGQDWWYPRVGANRFTGQIANHSQSCLEQTLGAAMRTADLPRSDDPTTLAKHVVIGTHGGYVFAIEPGDPADTVDFATPSTLSYASIDLGVAVVGLDVGNLDDDPELEIAAGCYVDTGSYGDWLAGDRTRNRAHLSILDPQPSLGPTPGSFGLTQLDGDDLVGLGEGIGAGVTGIAIDDVDSDGVNEIWCGDAVGHVWLFRRDGASWSCFFRSADLGAYPGIYNNLYPVKDAAGRTTRLVVVTAGYVMAFEVDWKQL